VERFGIKMSKKLTKLMALLLVIVMLFSASAVCISAASDANGGTASSGAASTDNGSGTTGTTNTPDGSFDLDWLEVEYTGNDVLVTVNPDGAGNILSFTKEDLNKLLRFVQDITKQVVFDDFKKAIVGENPPEDTVEFAKLVLKSTVDIYVKENYGRGDQAYNAFYDEMLKDDAAVTDFAEYLCFIAEAAVIARVVEWTQYPKPEEFAGEIENYLSEKINLSATTNSALLDQALTEKYGMTLAEVEARVAEIDAAVIAEYTDTFTRMKNDESGPDRLPELLTLVDMVFIDSAVLYGDTDKGKTFVLGTLKQIVKELPTFAEISEMDEDAMQLSYDFSVRSEITTSNFSITFKLGSHQAEVKKIAKILANNVDIKYLGGGVVEMDVNVPDELARAALKACKTSKVPDELKTKVFAAFSMDPESAHAFINNVTFDDLLKIFEYVDFDEVLDSEFVSRFESLDGLTEAQIKAKVREYERYYNKAIEILNKVYAYVPEGALDLTILDFYNSNGNFSVHAARDIDLYYWANKVDPALGDLVDAFLDKTTLYVEGDVSVTFQDVYKVSYNKGTELVREGLLPVGASIDFFSGETEYHGYPIIAWVDANGTQYTEMPEADIELYAITTEATAALNATATEKTYDGEKITLSTDVTYYPTATYAYTWYKNGVEIDGATAATLDIANVADSGNYQCVIKMTNYGVETTLYTNKLAITVSPAIVDLEAAIEWDDQSPFTYDGTEHSVNATVKAELAGIVIFVGITNNAATDADDYVAEATFKLVSNNYAFKSGDKVTLDWKINPITYDESDIQWVIGTGYTYEYGTEHTVTATAPQQLSLTLTGDKQTNAGTYTTEAAVAVVGGTNYAWGGSSIITSPAWTVAPQAIDLSTFAWESYNPADSNHNPNNFNLTYSGAEQGVKLVGVPADIAACLDYENDSATNATSANLVATAEVDDVAYTALTGVSVNNNYTISRSFTDCEWGIAKAVITVNNISWTATDFTYDGEEHKPTLDGFAVSGVSVSYTYEVRLPDGTYQAVSQPINAGHYRATVTILADDNTNYTVSSNIQTVIEYDIARKSITVDFAWDYTVPIEYTGSDITVTLDTSALTAEERALLNITGDTDVKVNANTYNALATVSIKTEYAGNYVLVVGGAEDDDNTVEYPLTWIIKKQAIALGTFTWNYTNPIEYTGSEITVLLDTTGISDKLEVAYTGNKGTNVSVYSAEAVISVLTQYDDNYEIASGAQTVYTLSWQIAAKVINLGNIGWDAFTNPVYNGQTQAAPTVTVPTEFASLVTAVITTTQNGSAATPVNAGTYVTSVEFEVGANYTLVYTPFTQTYEWAIERADLKTYLESLGIVFNGKTVTYNGGAHSLAIEGTLPANVTVAYTGNGQTEVGSYAVTATFTSTDPNYTAEAQMSATLVITAGTTPPPTIITSNRFVFGDIVIVEVGGEGIDANHVLNVVDELSNLANVDLSAIAGEGNVASFVAAYEVNFSLNDAPSDVTADFTVKILIPESYRSVDAEKLHIVYVNDQGVAEEVEATKVDNYLVFETTHFSIYGIVNVSPAQGGGDEPEPPIVEPPTDDERSLSWLWILIAILIAITVGTIVLLLVKKKDEDEGDDNEPDEEPEPEVIPPAVEEEPVVEEPVVEEPVVEEPVVEEPVVEEPVVEEPVVEEPVVEEPVVEEPVVEEPVVEEPVVEEPVVEEPVAEEPVVEEPAPAPAPGFFETIAAASENAEAVRLVNGVVVPVRYRTSFMSRLIQAEAPIQDYYTVVKNYLLSFKGVKARTSWNFESFNKGRIQCAKLNVKGNAFQVYLGLEPSEYSEEKYHFVDVSDKPKLDKVPMMLKVKSDRSLKYAIELIDEVMKKNAIEQGELPTEDYHMPYEATETLVDRDLVKVILPDGMIIDENTIIERVNVGDLLGGFKTAKPEDEASAEEAPVVEEAPVEEAPVEEAPVVEEPVVEEPVVEEPKVHIVDHMVLEEEIVNVDATQADEIISDEQATELIEDIVHAPGLKPKTGKCYEINLDTICENYEDGDTVTIENLKSKTLVTKKADRIKVLARGVMTRKLTVVADKFSLQAVKMIGLAGGLAKKYKD